MFRKIRKNIVFGVALLALCPVGADSVASSPDEIDQKAGLDLVDPEIVLEGLSAELADDAKLLLDELEQSVIEKDPLAVLDGLCVASPLFVRVKRISNQGSHIAFAEIAREIAAGLAAECPEASPTADFQDYVRNVIDSIIFLKQYADEYLDLVAIGIDRSFLDTVLFAGFEEKATASRLTLKKAAEDFGALRVKNFGQLSDLMQRVLFDMSKRFSLIASEDRTASLTEVELLDDAVENFFALSSMAEQEILGVFFQGIKEALSQNKRFVAAVQSGKNYLYSSSSDQPVNGIKLAFMRDCESDDECVSQAEAFFSYQDKILYTDIPVVIDPSLTAPTYVCGEVVRDETGSALRIVLGEHVEVKSLAELPDELSGKADEAKMVKRFIFINPTV